MPNLDINQLATSDFGISASGYIGSRGTTGSAGTAGSNGATGDAGAGSTKPKITNIQVTDSSYTVLDDTAVDTAGGYIKITGTGFASGCNVLINQTPATSVTFVSSTEVRAQVPATTAGTYIVYLVNSTGSVAIRVPGITFSATPSWVTASSLSGAEGNALSYQLSASGATTYSLQAGSTLPSGLTLSNVGLISGTVTGLSADTTYNFTVLATDTELQDSPRAFALTITSGEPYFKYTTLLLSANGTNNAQNNTFLDSSTNNYTVTRNGNPTQGTLSPYGDNWSNYFDGTGDYLTVPANSAMAVGTADFTFEAWIYLTGFNTWHSFVSTRGSASTGGATDVWCFGVNATGYLYCYSGDMQATGATGAIVLNTWYHVAISRSGSSMRLFVNGTQTGSTGTTSQNYTDNTLTLGANNDGSEPIIGYMSNARLIKGTALYTSAFTPSTTPLTSIANTVLLTCQSNRVIDNSPSNFAITKNGDVSVQKFNPFKLASVTPTSYSNYFDGSGDVLTVPANNVFAFGTGPFCIEAWIYNNVLKNYSCLVTTRPNNGSYADAYHIGWDSAGGVSLYVNTTATTGAPSGTIKTGQWQHFVCCRDSSNRTAMFVDGTRVGSDTVTNNFSRNLLGIGDFPTTQAECINGYISNLRLVKGSSVYDPTQTTITVPTGPLTTTSQGVTAGNVSILTCQSSTFVDNSTNNFAITATGSVQPRTLNPFGYTTALANSYSTGAIGGSAYLDGSGDYLDVTASAVNLSANWTIECWFQSTGISAIVFDTRPDGSNGFYPMLTGNGTTNQMNVYYNAADHAFTVGSYVGFWNHVAMVKNSGTLVVYFNGVPVYTVADSNTWSIGTNRPRIGANGGFLAGAPSYYTGYVSDFRVVNGTAVYTSSFVPPTAPSTAITNTRLLYKFTNAGIIDSAMMINVETAGDTKISTTQSKFGGSSVYFDGTGDWLVCRDSPNQEFGAGNLTWEMWINTASSTQYATLYSRTPASFATGMWSWLMNHANSTAGDLALYIADYSTSSPLLLTTGVNIRDSAWHHIAVVRNGSSWVLYVDGTSRATGTWAGTMVDIAYGPYIGADQFYGRAFAGYIDDFRITKGYARYTANFTPPASAFASK